MGGFGFDPLVAHLERELDNGTNLEKTVAEVLGEQILDFR